MTITMVIFLLSLFGTLSLASSSLYLLHQHPFPESVVQELHRRVNESFSRRQTQETTYNCHTGNPIDDCWRCDQNWFQNRQKLSDCGIGFGQSATGGKTGQIYIVTDSSDNDPQNPTPGTIRYGVVQSEPLWITFSTDMHITLKDELVFTSYKTIDGRGAKVLITGNGCLTLHNVNHVIVHGIEIRDCVASGDDAGYDGDGIHVYSSINVWIDHCTLSHCADGLIDVTEGSTAVTISNNYFSNHDKVMLLGHNDEFSADLGMQVTVAFNYFGPNLVQRMPRCRLGYVHVVNNDYTAWEAYAIGGSAKPTINSQGNRYSASTLNKEVTKRLDAEEKEWANWNWRSDGDIMVNGAFFVASGAGGLGTEYAKASSLNPFPAYLIDSLTSNAGAAFTRDVNKGQPSNPPPSPGTEIIYDGNGQNTDDVPNRNVATALVMSMAALVLAISLSCSIVY